MIKRIFNVIAFFLIVGGVVHSQSKVFYVSSGGSDNNSGRKISESLKSINKALEFVSAGDTVLIQPGTYNEVIKLNSKNGILDKPIVIAGAGENAEDYPVIDGGKKIPSLEASNYWITIENSNWIEFSKLKFQNGWVDPIRIKNSSYISYNKCNFYGGRRVIYATGENTHHLLIENCFWDQGGEFLWKVVGDSLGVDAWTSMHHESMSYFNGSIIDFRGTGGSVVIRNNEFINTFNAVRWRGTEGGFDSNIEIYNNKISYARDNDFEPETYSYNLHIYNNFLHNIHRTLSVDNLFGGFVYFYGNVITTDSDPWTQEVCKNVWKVYGDERNLDYPLYIFNNSYYGCQNAFRVDGAIAIKTKHFNNAYDFILNGKWILDKWDPTLEFDYDISNKEWPENMVKNNQEQNGKIADIKFVDPQKQDLRLQKTSPGIDAGKIMEFPELGWAQSYTGKAPDVGAYENEYLVEGPPFRFRIPPGSNLTYKEKPRIVRYKTDANRLRIFFSDEINTKVSNENLISVWIGEKQVKVKSIKFSNNYELLVETDSRLEKSKLSIEFNKLPKGLNGEDTTYWASAIKIKK